MSERSLTVGFIGLGNIGMPMAANIVAAGFPLIVSDLRAELVAPLVARGAVSAQSLAELARACDVVEVCVRDDAQVRDVLVGSEAVFGAVRPGTIIAIHSTIRPDTVRELGALASRYGLRCRRADHGRCGRRRSTFALLHGRRGSCLAGPLPVGVRDLCRQHRSHGTARLGPGDEALQQRDDVHGVRSRSRSDEARDGRGARSRRAPESSPVHADRAVASPEDLVGPLLFLLSEEARWITGHVLNVDGGQVMRA